MYISFTHPFYLVFLFAIPFLVFFHFYGLRNIRGKALKFANFDAIARVKGIDLYSKNIILLVFNIFFVVVLGFALAGLTLHIEMDASSFSYIIAIDNSRSMEASDILPNRLASAKETAINFVENLPFESYIGIVSFAGNSYIEQDLSKNKQEIKQAIENIQISPTGGTDIYEAISTSVNLLKKEESKALILLSDGQINVGSVNEAIQYAIDNDVIIHTFGIGTEVGGQVSYGMSKLDEDSLRALSYNTEGKFFSVNSKGDMERSFGEITNITRRLGSINLGFYLIMVAILLFIVKQFLISINKIVW